MSEQIYGKSALREALDNARNWKARAEAAEEALEESIALDSLHYDELRKILGVGIDVSIPYATETVIKERDALVDENKKQKEQLDALVPAAELAVNEELDDPDWYEPAKAALANAGKGGEGEE